MPRKYAELDSRILELLESSEPMTAADIGERLGIPRELAYRRGVYIEEHGKASHRSGKWGRTLYYSPVTGDVVTSATGPILRELSERIKAVRLENRSELTSSDKAKLRAVFDHFWDEQRAQVRPESRPSLDAFERQLLAIMKGTSVRSITGMAPFRAQERYFAAADFPWGKGWAPEQMPRDDKVARR